MRFEASVSANYEDLGLIGMGGMAEVRRVCDRRLNRTMAMKILRTEYSDDEGATARFIEEAQATAQLQHPGIVPVHEIGRLADGRIYFTMKEVQGRTLAQVIEDLHDLGVAGGASTIAAAALAARSASTSAALAARSITNAQAWSFRRVLDAFRAVCDAVAYAHSRGVVHRDLKPQNVMVGEFGEVLVLDWGLAMVLGRVAGTHAVSTDRSEDDALATRLGTVAGTPAYMPPEQARGETSRIGPASDVYSLGAILYQILSGRQPYLGSSAIAVLQQVITGPPPPLMPLGTQVGVAPDAPDAPFGVATMVLAAVPADAVLDEVRAESEALSAHPNPLLMPLPDELVAACRRAMAREPEDRFVDAAELAAEIAAWAEGARRREQGLARVAQAAALVPALAAFEAHANASAQEAQQRLNLLNPWDSAEQKQALWSLEDQSRELFERLEFEESRVERLLHTALCEAPDLPEAHVALANHYRHRFEQAMCAQNPGQDAGARRYEALLRGHDRGEHALWLNGDGALTLATEPAGAQVSLYKYVERGRRRIAEPAGTLGTTPLNAVRLPMGDWLLEISAEGCMPVRYPVSIGRLEHWDGVAPGESQTRKVLLPAMGAIRDDECYVPAGWYHSGGDTMASGSVRSERVWLEAFVVAKFPVTNQHYQQFLNALLGQARVLEAERYAPREQTDGPIVWRRQGDLFVLPDSWAADAPVVDIDWYGAAAYAQWSGGRLLSEDEWEKAARGTDRRIYPWGDGFDATFSRMRDSVQGKSSITSVTSNPVDESPYGVRSMAGNACSWCAGESAGRRPYRGGAWAFHQASIRSACRFIADANYRYFGLGVRVARDLFVPSVCAIAPSPATLVQ